MNHEHKTPITVVTGCLGSGKTTLLRNLLKDPSLQQHTAVIVNEFGKVGLDHHLLRKADESTILLDGGCICCNNREDLENELKALLSGKNKVDDIDRVIIETTGMADPAPILFTVLTNPLLKHHFYIDCVIATVDARNGHLHLKNNPELVKQVTVADKVILTKTDISSPKQKEHLKKELKTLNPSAVQYEVVHGEVEIDILKGGNKDFSQHSFNEPSKAKNSHYSSDIHSISFTFARPLDWTAFGLWLSALLHANGERIMRVKGLLDVGEAGPIVLNGVQHIIHPPDHLEEWPEENKLSHLIFIIRGIEPEKIEKSLKSFQTLLGTDVEMFEVEGVV